MHLERWKGLLKPIDLRRQYADKFGGLLMEATEDEVELLLAVPELIARVEGLEEALDRSQSAMVQVASVLGRAEAEAHSHSLPYDLKQVKIACDLAIVGNAAHLRGL